MRTITSIILILITSIIPSSSNTSNGTSDLSNTSNDDKQWQGVGKGKVRGKSEG